MRGAFIAGTTGACAITLACGSFGEGTPPSDAGQPPNDASVAEGSVEAPTRRCHPTSPFSAPQPLPAAINTSTDETYASLSPDELTIYFARSAGTGKRGLWSAVRTTRDAPFVDAQPVPNIGSSAIDDGLTVSADGLLGVFHSNRSDAAASMDLFFVKRANAAVPFAEPESIANVNTSLAETDAYLIPNKRRLYFGSRRTGGSRIYVADITESAGSYTFAPPTPLEFTLNDEGTPVVSDDELTIYFGSEDIGGVSRIFRSTRPSTSVPFGTPDDVSELNEGLTVPSWLSADGCVLYLSSDRDGNRDIFVATRQR